MHPRPWTLLAVGLIMALWLPATVRFADDIPFTLRVIDAEPPSSPWYKMHGDVDGDGDEDILVAGRKGPLVWYEYPGWKKTVIAPGGWSGVNGETGDVDGDGDVDIVMGGTVWFRNPRIGDGSWSRERIDSFKAHDIELGDLDGDGRPDVVARDQSAFGGAGDEVRVYRQEASSSWSKRAISCPHGEGLKVADVDADGDIDIVIGARWYRNDGDIVDGEWEERTVTTAYGEPDVKVETGDLNGDGRLDIVLSPAEKAGERSRISWFEGPSDRSDGEWREHVIADSAECVYHSLALGDLDGDGDIDVATAEMHQGADPDDVLVYENLGSGASWRRQALSRKGSHDIILADIGGDGDLDIIGANWSGGYQALELWENLGADAGEDDDDAGDSGDAGGDEAVEARREYHVAPDGKPENPGTEARPWDLASALGDDHDVEPGSTIRVGAGTYRGKFEVKLAGEDGAPIHVKPRPGARATILDSGLAVVEPADHVWIWGLEIAGSTPVEKRRTEIKGSHPPDLPGTSGLEIYAGRGCKFINLVIHDNVKGGVGWWVGSTDSELHGCIIYDNGWDAPDRGHGHCIYAQNREGTKTISGCILTVPRWGGSHTLHAYGSSRAWVDNFLIEENIAFEKGRFLVGGGRPSRNVKVLRNYLHGIDMQIGYSAPHNEDCEVRDNIIARGRLSIVRYREAVNEGNALEVPEAKAILIPNEYDPTRAHVAVYNGGGSPSVPLDVEGFLRSGDGFQLLDAEDVFGRPVLEGKVKGSTLDVPVSGEFATFVLLRR